MRVKTGSIYVADFGEVRKVGVSHNVKNRITALKTMFKLEPINVFHIEMVDKGLKERFLIK